MDLVEAHRQSLDRLQDRWDQLALLGQMSGIATDIGATATEFRQLSDHLLDALSQRLLDNALADLRGRAQVALDVLVRNLFERTADVGFLATDPVLCRFVQAGAVGDDGARAAVAARLAAYVRKYSVYDDVLLLDADGRLLARLDPHAPVGQVPADPLVAAALRGDEPYLEAHGPRPLLGGREGLVYAAALRGEGGRPCGVLCLSFRLQDEMAGIFGQLLGADAAAQLVLVDGDSRVIASSQPALGPPGSRWPVGPEADEGRPRIVAGREVLQVSARASGYQGYAGPPGWRLTALIPLELAFRAADGADDAEVEAGGDTLLGEALQHIPWQARRIQQGLALSVWNGQLEARRHAQEGSGRFAGALLHQVADAGERIRRVFDEAIADLHRSAAGDLWRRAAGAAALAVDILARNLYERANDCRWWALDPRLAAAVQRGGDGAEPVLAGIHALYTVYAQLLLFDGQGRRLAASRPADAPAGDPPAGTPWLARALALRDEQGYARSGFDASPFYGGRPTFTFAAPVGPSAKGAGGTVAIVFDAEPQLHAMLRDALPCGPDGRPVPGAAALFVDRRGRVLATSDDRLAPGEVLPWPSLRPVLATLPRGRAAHDRLPLEGQAVAVALHMAGGYREYGHEDAPADAGEDIACLVLMPLGPLVPRGSASEEADPSTASTPLTPATPPTPPTATGAKRQALASFALGGQWYALDAAGVAAALRVDRLNAVPNRPAGHAGWLLHEGRVLPVVDVGCWQQGRAADAGAGLVLVCQGGDGRRLGLRADALGGVFEVDADRLQPLPQAVADRHGVLSSMLRSADPQAPLLTVLALPPLLAHLLGGLPPEGQRLGQAALSG
jgi:chemotaxis signal transduction protein